MKKTNLLFCLFLILPLGVKSQNLQVFNGEFSCGLSQNGKAKYTYYEDQETHNYLKQGVFAFSILGKGDLAGLNQTINGSFDKGLKNGLWTYKTIMTNMSAGNYYYTGSITLIANYKNGYANGNWKLIRSYKSKTWYTAYGPLKTMTVSMNFLNGSLVGNVSIVDEFGNFKASGNYDNNSMCIGTWKIDDYGWNKHRELIYKDNVLYEFVARDNNGAVQEGTRKYQEDYDNYIKAKTMPVNEKDDAEFQIEIITDCGGDNSAATNNIKVYFNKLLSNTDFIYEQIGGDLTYKEGFKGGCEYSVKTQTHMYLNLTDNQNYKNAEEAYSKNNLLISYDLYTNIDLSHIKPSERQKITDKINLIKPKLKDLIETYHSNDKFFQEYTKAQYDSLELDRKIFTDKIILKVTDAGNAGVFAVDQDGKTKKMILQKVGKYYSYKYLKPWDSDTLEDAKSCFEDNAGIYNPIQITVTEQYFNYIKILEQEEKTIKNSKSNINFDNTYHSFYTYDKDTFLNDLSVGKKQYNLAKSLIDLKVKIDDKINQIESLNNQNKKKILYSKCQLVYVDYNNLSRNSSEIQSISDNYNNLNLFLDKIISLYPQETKELEKQLKEIETVKELKEIIEKTN